MAPPVDIPAELPTLANARGKAWKKYAPLYLLMAPSLILLITFFYYPAISGFFYSFTRWTNRGPIMAGLANYRRLINDTRLIASVGNLVQIVVFNVIVVMTMPLLSAVFMFRLPSHRAQFVYRMIYVFPMVVPSVVVLLIWRWMYSIDGGINIILNFVGLDFISRAWLGDRNLVLYAMMFVGFPWMGGLNFLIYLAGLQSIPTELFDAAKVDGIGPLGRFFRIELPLVRDQIRLLTLLTIIFWLQRFELPLILTDGGPGWASMVPGLRMYHTISRDYNLGYGSAIGTLLFLLVFAVTMMQLRVTRRKDQSV